MNRFYLFDGAILCEHGEDVDVIRSTEATHLYGDLGEEAARVGPVLIPETPVVLAFANHLISSEDSRRFATSLLFFGGHQSVLAGHLSQLRYLHTSHDNARRYFLRFADTRVLDGLSRVLISSQIHALLGCIRRWVWVAPDKTFLEFKTPVDERASAGLPLQLSTEQLSGFLRQGRYHELLNATQIQRPALNERGNLGERHAWTQQAHCWLEEHKIQHGGIRVAVNEATWRTQASVLAADDFAAVVRQAAKEGRPEVIGHWVAAHASKRTAL